MAISPHMTNIFWPSFEDTAFHCYKFLNRKRKCTKTANSIQMIWMSITQKRKSKIRKVKYRITRKATKLEVDKEKVREKETERSVFEVTHQTLSIYQANCWAMKHPLLLLAVWALAAPQGARVTLHLWSELGPSVCQYKLEWVLWKNASVSIWLKESDRRCDWRCALLWIWEQVFDVIKIKNSITPKKKKKEKWHKQESIYLSRNLVM